MAKPSTNQAIIMKGRLANAAKMLDEVNMLALHPEFVEELLNEIDGCSAGIREYIENG